MWEILRKWSPTAAIFSSTIFNVDISLVNQCIPEYFEGIFYLDDFTLFYILLKTQLNRSRLQVFIINNTAKSCGFEFLLEQNAWSLGALLATMLYIEAKKLMLRYSRTILALMLYLKAILEIMCYWVFSVKTACMLFCRLPSNHALLKQKNSCWYSRTI